MRNALFIVSIAFGFFISAHASAQTDARQVRRQSDYVNDLVQDNAHLLSLQDLEDVLFRLNQIRRIVDGHNPPPPPPPHGDRKYEATCHIDDDPDFDWDQNVVGTVRGNDINTLINECETIAQATYGNQGSSGIKDIALNDRARDVIYKATCHIDDDPDFDYDQNIAGTVGGRTTQDLVDDCAAIAMMVYGNQGSSGLKDIEVTDNVPYWYNVAECHIDDDPDFDYDQNVVGNMAGESVTSLIEQCQAVARETYGSQGSSGLKKWNEGRRPDPSSSSAMCHVDDDPDFDYDQVVVGRLFGRSISEITAGCAEIARGMYGSQGSSGIKDIQ